MDVRIARSALHPALGTAVRSYLGRPFGAKAQQRVVFYFCPNQISYSQAYPFLYYQRAFHDRFGADIRAVSVDRLLAGEVPSHQGVDLVLVQTWFEVDEVALQRAFDAVQLASPTARIAFLDSFAHSDVRLGRHVEPRVTDYLKKSLFRDVSLYQRGWEGGTNLTEYYGQLYDCKAEVVDWHTPAGLIPKLRLAPNFFTDPRFLSAFMDRRMPARAERDIDLHSRLGSRGTDWYSAMRRAATAVLGSMTDLRIAAGTMVPLRDYMRELSKSKLCFSPFGYGELCWRDIEAIQSGAVLIKPDMGHLGTLPNLFEPGVTYLPVRWDFSDLEEVVRSALADPDRCDRIAATAWQRVSDYLHADRFVDDMAFLFARQA